MIYDPVDFSKEKEEIKKVLGDLSKGEGESVKEPSEINFQKKIKDVEEFLDAAARGLSPLSPRPIQKNTMICVKVLERIKKEKFVSKSVIEEFLALVEQDLGNPSYRYLKKLIFGER